MEWEETKRVIDRLEHVIAKTPTGRDRNILTEANILLQALLLGKNAEDVIIKKSNTMTERKNYEKAWDDQKAEYLEEKGKEKEKKATNQKASIQFADTMFEEMASEFDLEERLEIILHLKSRMVSNYHFRLKEIELIKTDLQEKLAKFVHAVNGG